MAKRVGKRRLIESESRMNAVVYLMLIVCGASVTGTASYFASRLAPAVLSSPDASNLQNLLGNICASFTFLFVVELGRNLLFAVDRRHFRAFFGDLSEGDKARMVYPDFVLSDKCREMLKDVPGSEHYAKRSGHYSGARFIDVPHIVASNDLLGILIMATSMGKFLRDSPKLMTDGQAVDDHSRSLMSFGMTSNAVTDLYQNDDPVPLFRIKDAGGNPKIVVTVDGISREYGRDETSQHGIILKYRPAPEEYPHQVWIICAGLAAAGTPAAAWSLAHRWRQYYKRFGNRDFLIVFKTSNDVYAYTHPIEVASVMR